jgi:hypothetical protein
MAFPDLPPRDDIDRDNDARGIVRVSRCFAVRCPQCDAAPGVPCDERASRETPGNQFHTARIEFHVGRDPSRYVTPKATRP